MCEGVRARNTCEMICVRMCEIHACSRMPACGATGTHVRVQGHVHTQGATAAAPHTRSLPRQHVCVRVDTRVRSVMHVQRRVCALPRVQTDVCAAARVCTHVCAQMHVHANTLRRVLTRMCTMTRMCTGVSVHLCACWCVYTATCAWGHVCTHTR